MTIVEKMQDQYSKMTEGEKRIYGYIIENSTLFSLRSIQEIAEHLEISKTSLVRFAKMLGFEGYSQFKKKLQEEEILRSTPSQRLRKLQESNYIHNAKQMRDQEISTLQDIYSGAKPEDVEKAVHWILRSRKIHIVGWREGFFMAEILNYRLGAIGFSTQLLSRSISDFDEQLIHSKKEDLMIAFDFYKYSKAVHQALKECQAKSMPIICVTDSPICPGASIADQTFFCPSKTDYLLNSMTGPLFWINMILSEIYGRTNQQFLDMLEKREHLHTLSSEYEKGGIL